MPEGTPGMMQLDHSWTLQAVMEMKKDLGVLIERIDRVRDDISVLTTKVDDNCEKVGKINTKLAWVAGIVAGVTGLTLVIWAVINVIPWNRITVAPPVDQTISSGSESTQH